MRWVECIRPEEQEGRLRPYVANIAVNLWGHDLLQHARRYQWTILPKEMINSPSLCQYFVSQPLEIIRKQFLKSIIYHYMDDILLPDSNADTLERMFEKIVKALPKLVL